MFQALVGSRTRRGALALRKSSWIRSHLATISSAVARARTWPMRLISSKWKKVELGCGEKVAKPANSKTLRASSRGLDMSAAQLKDEIVMRRPMHVRTCTDYRGRTNGTHDMRWRRIRVRSRADDRLHHGYRRLMLKVRFGRAEHSSPATQESKAPSAKAVLVLGVDCAGFEQTVVDRSGYIVGVIRCLSAHWLGSRDAGQVPPEGVQGPRVKCFMCGGCRSRAGATEEALICRTGCPKKLREEQT